jgi:hypothetical protein
MGHPKYLSILDLKTLKSMRQGRICAQNKPESQSRLPGFLFPIFYRLLLTEPIDDAGRKAQVILHA